jgi:DNA recombination protein RmuC
MLELILVAVGLALGGGVAWMLARARAASDAATVREALQARLAAHETLGDELRKQLSQRELDVAGLRSEVEAERVQRAHTEARWESARAGVEEQRRLLDEARERLTEVFATLSAEALRQSNTSFLELAREAIEAQLGRRQEAIDGLVRPIQETLRRYEEQARQLEAARQQAYGSLEQHLRTLAASSAELQRETGNLVTALRAPQVRGRWGELTLHRVVELAGMAEHCDYVEQVTVEGDEGRLRPDMVVHLPAGRDIVVDAKVPLTAYLDALTVARTEEERRAALARHAQQIRQHMGQLAGKAYWDQFASAPELVVMFIPGESFVAAAVEVDGSLIEDGMARRVVVATPTTLIALLRAIAYGWRQERLAANAEQISELGRELYKRLATLAGHFEDVGGSLARAIAAYNKAVGSMETRVLPAARRFRDLGAATGEEIAALGMVDQLPRPLTAPEFPQQLSTPEAAP